MRVQPLWWIGVIVVLVYNAIVSGLWVINQVDYLTIAEEANIFGAIILPLAVGAAMLIVVTSAFGWWRVTLFEAGTGFYILRRLNGSLLLPIALHAAWDFVTLSHTASGAEVPAARTLFQFGTYILAMVLVVFMLRADGRSRRTAFRRSGRESDERVPQRGNWLPGENGGRQHQCAIQSMV